MRTSYGSFAEKLTRSISPALLSLGLSAAMYGGGASSAVAAPALGLYNTGIDPGIMLGMDNHYTVTYEGGSAGPVATYVTDLTNLPYSPANDSTSAFIAPQSSYANGQYDAGGLYDFTTTFTVPEGTSLSAVSILGRFESDDQLKEVYLNGQPLGISLNDPEDYKGFSQYFNLTSGGFLISGTNTLTFKVFNYTNQYIDPVALRTEFIAAVPEPSVPAVAGSLALLTGVSVWLRRRRIHAAC